MILSVFSKSRLFLFEPLSSSMRLVPAGALEKSMTNS